MYVNTMPQCITSTGDNEGSSVKYGHTAHSKLRDHYTLRTYIDLSTAGVWVSDLCRRKLKLLYVLLPAENAELGPGPIFPWVACRQQHLMEHCGFPTWEESSARGTLAFTLTTLVPQLEKHDPIDYIVSII